VTGRSGSRGACLLCGGEVQVVVELPPEPVLCNALAPTATSARAAAVGPMALGVCRRCGVGHNEAFDPSLVTYGTQYENSLHFSGTFRAYAEELAVALVDRHRLAGRRILEIGAGNGDFLALLCESGGAGTTGVGFDPSCPQDGRRRDGATPGAAQVELVRAFYPTTPEELDADFVCCRHVLEHLDDPRALVEGLRASVRVGRSMVAYVEVPDAGYMLAEGAVWDLIYEHPWYYTEPALRRLFASAGFTVLATGSSYGGQYLWIEVRAAGGTPVTDLGDGELASGVDEVLRDAERFRRVVEESVGHAAEELAIRLGRGERLVLWGAGSKGVSFLNRVPGADRIEAVVDLNPRKHGRFVPVTGQLVVPPEALATIRPDAVIVLNPLYRSEIGEAVERLGIRAEVLTLGSVAPQVTGTSQGA
jgi:SAM-dependent methyltransferase